MSNIFVKQLDGCTYCSGGQNCSCACHAMWLYRASGGRIKLTACQVRRKTGDTSGGTNLRQMATITAALGVKAGSLWLPGSFAKSRQLVLSGRYGGHFQIGYNIIANTQWDCFEGNFRGGHDWFIKGGTANVAYVGDPGADHRRSGIPLGYQAIPWEIVERACATLPLSSGGPTLAQEYGSGYVFTYLTPPDPVVSTERWKVVITGQTGLYDAPYGRKVSGVTAATYICTESDRKNPTTGVIQHWFQILPTAKTDNRGLWISPSRYTAITRYAS